MLSKISSLRMINCSVKKLPQRNISFINDTLQNVIPLVFPKKLIVEASKSGIVSTVTGKAHQKIKEKNKIKYEQNEYNENTKNPKKIKLNYPKFLLVGMNNLITMFLFDCGIFEITQNKDKILEKTKEFYSKTKKILNSRDEVQEYISFSNDDVVCGNYKGSFKNIKAALLNFGLKARSNIKNEYKMPFPDEISPSTPDMLYRNLCCQNIKLNDFEEAYNDVKKNVTNKESKLHIGLKKISVGLGLELFCQLAQKNLFGKLICSTNLLPKCLNEGIFKTLTQNIIVSFKKIFLLNSVKLVIKNIGSNDSEENNIKEVNVDKSKKQGSD